MCLCDEMNGSVVRLPEFQVLPLVVVLPRGGRVLELRVDGLEEKPRDHSLG